MTTCAYLTYLKHLKLRSLSVPRAATPNTLARATTHLPRDVTRPAATPGGSGDTKAAPRPSQPPSVCPDKY